MKNLKTTQKKGTKKSLKGFDLGLAMIGYKYFIPEKKVKKTA